jgi:lipopolysaccharide/colanic/teichoic acid biosynthesis glycosyltransferase
MAMSTFKQHRTPLDQLRMRSNRAGLRYSVVLERLCDCILAGLIILATLPLLGFVAMAIWSQNAGPVFCREERFGRAGRPFAATKFRTTVLLGLNEQPTRLGRVLRFTRIDELPQVINVWRGELSLVGSLLETVL